MPKTIMIVDDALSIRGLVRMTLENVGYSVIEANHGRDALEKLNAASSVMDLIILDLYMPEMDGMALIAALKAESRLRRIPLVVLTKETDPAARRRGQEAGAKAWVVKPFRPNTILNVVQRIIG